MTKIAKPTADTLATLKNNCTIMGCKVRTKQLSGSLARAVRIVLVEGSWDQLRDACVLSGVITTTGTEFTAPTVRSCFDGSQINVWFKA